MGAIDIGASDGTQNRAGASTTNYTYVLKSNPANADGNITSVTLFVNDYGPTTTCKIIIFYVVSGNNLTARSSVDLGVVAAATASTRAVNLVVKAGDYIGFYLGNAKIEASTDSGDGRWYASGDQSACVNTAFSTSTPYDYSLYGTGVTLSKGSYISKLITVGMLK